jgi:hypothetical protein
VGVIANTVKWQPQVMSMKTPLLRSILQVQPVDSWTGVKKRAGEEFVSRRVSLTGLDKEKAKTEHQNPVN